MRPSERIAAIFEREIERLDATSKANPLDAADLDRFVKLVTGYRKYTPTDPEAPETSDALTTDELLKYANPARATPAEESES